MTDIDLMDLLRDMRSNIASLVQRLNELTGTAIRLQNQIYMIKIKENTDFRKNYTIDYIHNNWLIIVRRGKVKKRVIEYYKQDYTAQKDIVVWKRDLCSNKSLKPYRKHYGEAKDDEQ